MHAKLKEVMPSSSENKCHNDTDDTYFCEDVVDRHPTLRDSLVPFTLSSCHNCGPWCRLHGDEILQHRGQKVGP